ncbi:MAG: glycosyltransferase family 4 protein [Tannerellaceae bacterium]|jgi:glycosyltransferase involved in cell wall biosynthesis|nr:glycosyltransferase family 4 protein [Tannerellaceae bacterium]
MKILFIVPGSGDPFYCGNCFRDNQQANALRKAGLDVVVMPLYLPLKDRSFLADAPLFFPATSFFLSQKYFKQKALPRWLERALGSGPALRLAASFSGTTSAEGLEQMTLSMIAGSDEVFERQSDALLEWIGGHGRPDVVHLSSSLISGVGRRIKEHTGLPVVCSLQDEEVWIDGLKKPWAEAAWEGIAANMLYIDSLTVSSEFYRRVAERRFAPPPPVHVVYPGFDTERYASASYPPDPTLGFFYRTNEANGLDILAGAFVQVKRSGRLPRLRLRIGGGSTSADRPFLRKVRRMLAPFREDVDWCEGYRPEDHAAFYGSVSAVCVPIRFEESVGLYLCEAFAAGRPAIEPRTGSFPEITGEAGLLYEPNDSRRLAAAIEEMFTADGLWEQCRDRALQLSASRYNHAVLAASLYRIYEDLLQK